MESMTRSEYRDTYDEDPTEPSTFTERDIHTVLSYNVIDPDTEEDFELELCLTLEIPESGLFKIIATYHGDLKLRLDKHTMGILESQIEGEI